MTFQLLTDSSTHETCKRYKKTPGCRPSPGDSVETARQPLKRPFVSSLAARDAKKKVTADDSVLLRAS